MKHSWAEKLDGTICRNCGATKQNSLITTTVQKGYCEDIYGNPEPLYENKYTQLERVVLDGFSISSTKCKGKSNE